MCRSIKKLRTDPPVTKAEIDAAALQFVRKVSGFPKPSKANQAAFEEAVRVVSETTQQLLERIGARSGS